MIERRTNRKPASGSPRIGDGGATCCSRGLARLRRSFSSIAVALLALNLLSGMAATEASAEEPGAGDEPTAQRSDWSFSVVPYLWLPQLQGSVSTRGRSASFDVGFDDVFDLLGDGKLLAGMGHFEAKYRRYSFFVDAIGGTMRPSSQFMLGPRGGITGNADLTMNFTYLEFGPAVRVFETVTGVGGRPIAIDLLAGGRFMYFYQSIGIQGSGGRVDSTARATTTWVDPFVGGRWSVPLGGPVDLFFRGDIGGFGAGSELAWNIVSGFEIHLPWSIGSAQTSAFLGYKAFDFEYDTGSGENAVTLALNQRGPAIGIGFKF